MKKKTIAIIVSTALVALLVPALAFAVTGNGSGSLKSEAGVNYVDADGDGVCDYSGSGAGVSYIDADSDSICDNYDSSTGSGAGGNYVDDDSDGVCDNYGTRQGQGQGQGKRNGCCNW